MICQSEPGIKKNILHKNSVCDILSNENQSTNLPICNRKQKNICCFWLNEGVVSGQTEYEPRLYEGSVDSC